MHSKWNIIKIKFSIEISTGNLLNHSIFECTEIWGIVKSLGKFVQPTSKYFNFFNFDTCTLILESIYNNNIWRILLFTNALLHSVKNYFKQYIQIITISWKNKQTGNLWSTPSLPPPQKELFYTWLILSRIHSLLFLHQNLWLPPPLQVLFYTTHFQPHIRTYCQGPLQFAGGDTETVEHQVLPHAVDPLTPGGQDSTHKVPTLSLTTGETPHNLQ